jgi:hypothetical protein
MGACVENGENIVKNIVVIRATNKAATGNRDIVLTGVILIITDHFAIKNVLLYACQMEASASVMKR